MGLRGGKERSGINYRRRVNRDVTGLLTRKNVEY